MKNLSIAAVIEKNKIASSNAIVFILDIDIVDPLTSKMVDRIYLTNHYSDIHFEDHTYIKVPFNLDLKNEAGEIQNLTLSVQDQVGMLTPALRRYQGAVGSQVLARMITITPDNETTAVDFAEIFQVLSSSNSNYVVSFELGAENPLTRLCPARTQLRDRCSFRYKSYECGYNKSMTGDKDMESCDLTLNGKNGCNKHNNTKRFGGCPALTVARL